MKVLLIVPHRESTKKAQYKDIPQLGVGYLAAVLLKAGVDCNIIDARMETLKKDEIVKRAYRFHPDVIGFSSMTHEVAFSHDLAIEIKKTAPGVTTIIGGCHVTALPVRTMEEFGSFDLGVVGEGEETVKELIIGLQGKKELSSIAGLVVRKSGKIVVTPSRKWIENIDAIPFPAWELVPATSVYPVMASRGCPFLCNFCMRTMGTKVRLRSPQNILSEVNMLVDKFGAKDIRFRDETFTANGKNVLELLNLFIESGLSRKIVWSVTTHANTIDKELLRRMKDAGCVGIGLGIESGNDEILSRMGKNITVKKAKEAVAMAKAVGLQTGAFFILGHPHETKETINDTRKLATQLNTTTVAFGTMVPYPGTEIYKNILEGKGGYRIISYNWADWDKYLGGSVELENLPRVVLEKEQALCYISFYLGNLRVKDLLVFLWKNRNAIGAFLSIMLKKTLRFKKQRIKTLSGR